MKRLTKNIQIFSLLALFIAFSGCKEDDDTVLPEKPLLPGVFPIMLQLQTAMFMTFSLSILITTPYI